MIVREVSAAQSRDTGLALVLALLLVTHFSGRHGIVPFAIGALVLTMLWPLAFKPLAYVWFTVANILRRIVSTILLTTLFVVIATPIGWIRRLIGADPMQVRPWKRGRTSVFVEREHAFSGKDLEKPY